MAATYYIIKGIAPPDLARYPDSVRLMYHGWVVELGLRRKDWELSRGLAANGQPLAAVSRKTRRRRKSAMTPTGKGDPGAPYLMPGRGLSRTRSLLAGKAHRDYAEFYWRYDAHTGDQWGKILAYHAARGASRNVVGLSPAGVRWVQEQAAALWRRWLANPATATIKPIAAQKAVPVAMPKVPGSTNFAHATPGIGGDVAAVKASGKGFMTQAQWAAYWRESAPIPAAAQAPSVRKGSSNVILQHVWAQPVARPAAAPQAAPLPYVVPFAGKPPARVVDAANRLVGVLRRGGSGLTVEQLLAATGYDWELFGRAIFHLIQTGGIRVTDGRAYLP